MLHLFQRKKWLMDTGCHWMVEGGWFDMGERSFRWWRTSCTNFQSLVSYSWVALHERFHIKSWILLECDWQLVGCDNDDDCLQRSLSSLLEVYNFFLLNKRFLLIGDDDLKESARVLTVSHSRIVTLRYSILLHFYRKRGARKLSTKDIKRTSQVGYSHVCAL